MGKAALIAIGLSLMGATSAAAATPPPVPPIPAIAQYVETVPTSQGPAVPGGTGRAPLAPGLTHRLQSSGGQLLENVATSAAYGAPQTRLHVSKRVAAETRKATAKPPHALSGSAIGAAGNAVGAGHGVVLWLALALAGITAAGAAAAIRRGRR